MVVEVSSHTNYFMLLTRWYYTAVSGITVSVI